MLSFNALGNMGRLGNQMFEFAALKGIARRHGYDFCIPPREAFGTIDADVAKSPTLFDIFDLSDVRIWLTESRTIAESTHGFDSGLFNLCPDNVDLSGYFQSPHYFSHIAAEIRRDFGFPEALVSLLRAELADLASGSGTIALHVRRGDYIERQHLHLVLPITYYASALGRFDENAPVLVFSDDIPWCRRQPLFAGERFTFVEGRDERSDLCLMSLCDAHVVANSSFSWWGAWLAQGGPVIAPRTWFGPELAMFDRRDIYDLCPRHWTVLDIGA